MSVRKSIHVVNTSTGYAIWPMYDGMVKDVLDETWGDIPEALDNEWGQVIYDTLSDFVKKHRLVSSCFVRKAPSLFARLIGKRDVTWVKTTQYDLSAQLFNTLQHQGHDYLRIVLISEEDASRPIASFSPGIEEAVIQELTFTKHQQSFFESLKACSARYGYVVKEGMPFESHWATVNPS